MIKQLIVLGVFLTLLSCGSSTEKVDKIPSAETSASLEKKFTDVTPNPPDTSNQYIYDFMRVVIADQEINLKYGLTIEPEKDCDLSKDDQTFLMSLLIEEPEPKSNSGDMRNGLIVFNFPPKYLTKDDIDDMLLQKKNLSNFTWDYSRLGFKSSDNSNWYSFSLPLFSKDKKTAVMMIRDLCSGLCGTGKTVVFKKQDNVWTSLTVKQWIH